MKTKELLEHINTDNNFYIKLKQLDVKELTVKEVYNYYNGDLDGVVEINNELYYFTYTTDVNNYRLYVVVANTNYKFSTYEELFNRDLEVIGYFLN